MSDATLRAIQDTLTQERQALVSADFASLTPLVLKVEQLVMQLSPSSATTADLKAIGAQIDENQALLAASIKGVAAARDRLNALLTVQAGLSVYDQDGTLSTVQNNPQSLEKKA